MGCDALARTPAPHSCAPTAAREPGPIFSTPSEGYAVEREQDGRVLFS